MDGYSGVMAKITEYRKRYLMKRFDKLPRDKQALLTDCYKDELQDSSPEEAEEKLYDWIAETIRPVKSGD